MRAFVVAIGASLIAACSIGALDGFSGEPLPDGGTSNDANTTDTNTSPDAQTETDSGVDANVDTGTDAPATSPYHLAVLADAPVAHFALDDETGTKCANSTSGSAVCLYPPDKMTRGLPGIGGTKAVRFDDKTATLTVSGVPGDLSKPYTVELWLRLDTVAADTDLAFFQNPAAGNGDGFNLFLWDNARIRTELWMAGSLIAYGLGPSALAAGTWHHVVIAHSTNPHLDLFYLDAQLLEHDTNELAARPNVTSPFKVVGFVGLVDEIAIYDKALDGNRIAAHYAAQ